MVSRKNLIYSAVGLLLVVGIILGVLGGLGYLTPKGSSILPPGVPSLNIKNASVTITDFDQTTGTVKYTVNNPDKEYAHFLPLNVHLQCNGSKCPSNTNQDIINPIDIQPDTGNYSFTSSGLILPKGSYPTDELPPRAYIWFANGYSDLYTKQLQ